MALSPMMQHYLQIKDKHKDAVVFYRLGDFYEMFFDDAIEMSKVLDLTLTGRDCGLETRAPMCGIPFHASENYIAKLIKQGYKVAICEQLTEAQKGKQVARDVIKVITPGTITSDNMLEEKQNNYILCVAKKKDIIGVAYADISTGDFYTTEFKTNIFSCLNDLLVRINPAEIICNQEGKDAVENLSANLQGILPKSELYYEWAFENNRAESNLKNQFSNVCLNIYEINQMPCAILASGAILEYLNETQKIALAHITKIKKIDTEKYMVLDITARRNLEIVETIRDRKKKGSLLSILDNTKTSMGGRLFRNWIDQPLKNSKEINQRLNAVEELYKNLILRDNLSTELKKINDIERLSAKIGMRSIMPKECESLKNSLTILPTIKHLLSSTKSEKLTNIFNNFPDFSQLQHLLDIAIKNEPALHLKDGGYIKQGYNANLDELIKIQKDGANWIVALEQKEREDTNLKNLKIKYNNVYGYYIEIARTLADQVPIRYHRKQTVGNFDRYFTEELKILEEKILGAEDKSIKLEQQLFAEIREKLLCFIQDLQVVSESICQLDCLLSLAQVAIKNNYTKPKINEKIKEINIVDGRHPVVETYLKDEQFIANDTNLNQTDEKIMIITGPNMAGKSTFMRQVAVITLLAHIGSFVPAKSAEIAITDRIFTRVGASDDLAFGQSTFMVKMVEMANILHNATDNSLIILDEIGRGTSTFDGLSIAWA
ncbi:MAG: DNA mismatch repair protein MutS, partial [Clostridia bacterium]|nr:DNA mismatch repair protein MutS [Clostridia bacterium]